MARLWSSGAELNSATNQVEYTTVSLMAPETGVVRSGTYALRSNPTGGSTEYLIYTHAATPQADARYYRFYLYIATSLGATETIFSENGNVKILLNADNTLELWNDEDEVQVGLDSPALNTGTWYRIELKIDATTLSSTSIECRIDGTSFASGTINLLDGQNSSIFGIQTPSSSGDLYFDDIAINDSTGSFQNSWPGEGEIIHLRPDSAGDNEAWNDGTGTTFAEVDEITPDDVTTHIEENTANAITDFNLDATPAALASDDTINVVQVGVRFASEGGSSSNSTFALRIKASAGGTVEEGSTITPASTTYSTNAPAAPSNYNLTLYDLPGASTTAWTKADLDTAQIGVKLVANDFWEARVSTLWLLVDHKPAEAPAGYGNVFISNKNMLNVGV